MSRPKKGDMLVHFVYGDGSSDRWHAPADKIQEKHRLAIRAACDAWVEGIHPPVRDDDRTVEQWHDDAMKYADRLLDAKGKHLPDVARMYALLAFNCELAALRRASELKASLASRAILLRSLTHLAHDAFTPDSAPPEQAPDADELKDLQRMAIKHGFRLVRVDFGLPTIVTPPKPLLTDTNAADRCVHGTYPSNICEHCQRARSPLEEPTPSSHPAT